MARPRPKSGQVHPPGCAVTVRRLALYLGAIKEQRTFPVKSNLVRKNKWMKEWMNEWMNERIKIPEIRGGTWIAGGRGSAARFSERYPLLITESCRHTHFYDEFWRKTTHFLLFFANFLITHPCLWKICRKRDPCLGNLGPKNPPIWAAHTSTLNMLCTPPGPEIPSFVQTGHPMFSTNLYMKYCNIFFPEKNGGLLQRWWNNCGQRSPYGVTRLGQATREKKVAYFCKRRFIILTICFSSPSLQYLQIEVVVRPTHFMWKKAESCSDNGEIYLGQKRIDFELNQISHKRTEGEVKICLAYLPYVRGRPKIHFVTDSGIWPLTSDPLPPSA